MRFTTYSTITLALVALVGCGSAYQPETGSAAGEPEGSAEEYEGRIGDLQARLDLALGHPPSQLAPGESEVLHDLEAEDAPMQEYEAAPHPASEPDCDVAADLRNRICELAARICRIAENQPNDADLQGMCERATAACEDARRDVTVNCE